MATHPRAPSHRQAASPARSPAFFFQFLGAHSLLIGLLPFFLPVYLWQQGLSLAGLCWLIGFSGLTFCAALGLWQHIWQHWKPRHLITLTFALELLLIVSVGLCVTVPGAALFSTPDSAPAIDPLMMLLAAAAIGVANGLYNAFFWTTQRSLFLQQLGDNDTGRQYGNFQIFVTLFLKLGILLGGWLLDIGGFIWLLALSAGIAFAANAAFAGTAHPPRPALPVRVTLLDSIRYQDRHGSRWMFMIDGIFLYLESHFWTLTLFFVVQEDFSTLGIAVVILAASFAVIFYLIKNRIDLLPLENVFKVAVWLYAASWLLRLTLGSGSSGVDVLASLIVITFCSSFFRLALNKRFFDVARSSSAVRYLLLKSYNSQVWLGVFFMTAGLLMLGTPWSDQQLLQWSYLPAAALSLLYLRYRNTPTDTDTQAPTPTSRDMRP